MMPHTIMGGRVVDTDAFLTQPEHERIKREQRAAAAAEAAERDRQVAEYRARESRLRAREQAEREQAKAELEPRLAPWRKERDRLAHLLVRANEQITRAAARADRDPLSIPKQMELLGATRAVEQTEAKVNAHDQVKPT
jgi:hypothetical protein